MTTDPNPTPREVTDALCRVMLASQTAKPAEEVEHVALSEADYVLAIQRLSYRNQILENCVKAMRKELDTLSRENAALREAGTKPMFQCDEREARGWMFWAVVMVATVAAAWGWLR